MKGSFLSLCDHLSHPGEACWHCPVGARTHPSSAWGEHPGSLEVSSNVLVLNHPFYISKGIRLCQTFSRSDPLLESGVQHFAGVTHSFLRVPGGCITKAQKMFEAIFNKTKHNLLQTNVSLIVKDVNSSSATHRQDCWHTWMNSLLLEILTRLISESYPQLRSQVQSGPGSV